MTGARRGKPRCGGVCGGSPQRLRLRSGARHLERQLQAVAAQRVGAGVDGFARFRYRPAARHLEALPQVVNDGRCFWAARQPQSGGAVPAMDCQLLQRHLAAGLTRQQGMSALGWRPRVQQL